ncbi:unnamed protein product [marine sediment metagenome]|uniref:Uncharacterized protein n=1 Tax=marine sediment metagenome TaxID=412755 RepID=X1BFL0_9ZZZZ
MARIQLAYEIIKLFDVITDPITGERKVDLDKQYARYIQDNFDQIVAYTNEARESHKHTITLLPKDAILPVSNKPALTQINSTSHSYNVLDFDKDTAETCYWHLTIPASYNDQPITVKIKYIANATTGDVIWVAGIRGIDPNENVNYSLGEEDNIFTPDTVNATANYLNVATLSIHSRFFKKGEWLSIPIRRFANNGDDTLTVDARLLEVVMEWEN